jgi:hypothetical protein
MRIGLSRLSYSPLTNSGELAGSSLIRFITRLLSSIFSLYRTETEQKNFPYDIDEICLLQSRPISAYSEPNGDSAESSSTPEKNNKSDSIQNSLGSSKAGKIFEIVQRAFEEVLGEAAGKGLASRLNPSIVADQQRLERELRRLLGYGADIIIDAVRAMLAAAHISLPLSSCSSTLSSSSNVVKTIEVNEDTERNSRYKRRRGSGTQFRLLPRPVTFSRLFHLIRSFGTIGVPFI